MAASPEPITTSVAKARFAAWVKRTLDAARDRGESDKTIHAKTKVSPSTFHRWQAGDGKELPELEKVKWFARGLGASVDDALTALGVNDTRPSTTPEPSLTKEMRTILRALADPNTPDTTKLVIKETLAMLADRAAASSRRRIPPETEGKIG